MLSQYLAFRWLNCPGSALPVQGQYPIEPSDLTRECDAARWCVDALLKREIVDAREFAGRQSPRGGTVTESEIEAANEFFNAVRSAHYWEGEWHGIHLQVISRRPDGQRGVTVFGFNYGWKPTTRPLNHAALLLSACAAYDPAYDESVTLCIFQPRPYHPAGSWRNEALSIPQVTQQAAWIVERAAAAGNSGYAIPGTYCSGCPHATNCDALRQAGYAEYERPAGAVTGEKQPAEAFAKELSHVEDIATLVNSRLKAMQAEARARILAGEWLPGWRLADEEGPRELNVLPSVASFMLNMPVTEQVLLSPHKLEKAGADKAIMKRITTRPKRVVLRRLTETEIGKLLK